MEVFTQFSSDLDEATKHQLVYGQGLMQLLKQNQYHPMSQHEQVISLVAALGHIMQDVPVSEIKNFQSGLLSYCKETIPDITDRIDSTGKLTDDDKADILSVSKDFLSIFRGGKKRGEEDAKHKGN